MASFVRLHKPPKNNIIGNSHTLRLFTFGWVSPADIWGKGIKQQDVNLCKEGNAQQKDQSLKVVGLIIKVGKGFFIMKSLFKKACTMTLLHIRLFFKYELYNALIASGDKRQMHSDLKYKL